MLSCVCSITDHRKSFFYFKIFQHSSKAGLSPPWQTGKKLFDVIFCLYNKNEAISFVVIRSKELWLVQENHATVKLNSKVASRGMNLQRQQNWTAKSTILKENPGKLSQFLSSGQPCEPKSLDFALNIAGVDKNPLRKLAIAVNIGG